MVLVCAPVSGPRLATPYETFACESRQNLDPQGSNPPLGSSSASALRSRAAINHVCIMAVQRATGRASPPLLLSSSPPLLLSHDSAIEAQVHEGHW